MAWKMYSLKSKEVVLSHAEKEKSKLSIPLEKSIFEHTNE